MKKILFLSIFIFCTSFSKAQYFASATPAQNATEFSFASHSFLADSTYHRTRHTSYTRNPISNLGSWVLLGGLLVGVGGIIEQKNATVNYGYFSVVDEAKKNRGTIMEVVGGLGVFAGIVMIVEGSSHHYPRRGSKISIYSTKPNELGLAIKL